MAGAGMEADIPRRPSRQSSPVDVLLAGELRACGFEADLPRRQLRRGFSVDFLLPGESRVCEFEASSPSLAKLPRFPTPYPRASSDEAQGKAAAAAGSQVASGLVALYLFAFFSQFKPSEPFLVDYFLDSKGLSPDEVYRHVFDLFIYSRLPCVALVGVASGQRWGGGRRILAFGAACGLATVLLTRFGRSLASQQAAQFAVAASFASRMACPAVAFGLAMPDQYQASVSTLKAVMLLSNCAAAVLGEVLRDYARVPLNVLFDVSVAAQALSLGFALLLLATPPCDDADEAPTSQVHVGSKEPSSDAEPSGSTDSIAVADFRASLAHRGVRWWTAWALWMNPVHGLVMTYWQGLVRDKTLPANHNGALSAGMYLASAVLTCASGSVAFFGQGPALLVVMSMFGAGLLLLEVVAAVGEVQVYLGLLVYQCLFEVMTAVATFQVGVGVLQSFATARGRVQTDRLTVLFSATTIASSANENLILVVVNDWSSIDTRFLGLGALLEACAIVLALASIAEALRSSRPAAIISGKLMAAPVGAAPVGRSCAAAPLLGLASSASGHDRAA